MDDDERRVVDMRKRPMAPESVLRSIIIRKLKKVAFEPSILVLRCPGKLKRCGMWRGMFKFLLTNLKNERIIPVYLYGSTEKRFIPAF